MLSLVCSFFSKSCFSKSSFRNAIRVSNSLDPDPARHVVGPDQGPNCCRSYQHMILAGRVDKVNDNTCYNERCVLPNICTVCITYS